MSLILNRAYKIGGLTTFCDWCSRLDYKNSMLRNGDLVFCSAACARKMSEIMKKIRADKRRFR